MAEVRKRLGRALEWAASQARVAILQPGDHERVRALLADDDTVAACSVGHPLVIRTGRTRIASTLLARYLDIHDRIRTRVDRGVEDIGVCRCRCEG
jgi:hypothetical protein